MIHLLHAPLNTATVLFVIALPMLVGCLVFAGGILLAIPLALMAIAFGLLKACV